MKTALITILVMATAVIASAQTKTFKWENPACVLEGRYDSAKYSEKQLKDTSELLSSLGAIPLLTRTSVFRYENIVKLSVEDFDEEYKMVSEKLKKLDIIKEPYWENFRKAKIKETDEFYQLRRFTMRAYENPSVLRQYQGAPFCKDFYVEPLIAGGDYLRATWAKVNMDSRAKNGDPNRLKKAFEIESARSDWEEIARVYVMTFGWGNCANKTIPYVENDGSQAKEFRKLFSKVKEECDEP